MTKLWGLEVQLQTKNVNESESTNFQKITDEMHMLANYGHKMTIKVLSK